MRKANKEDTEIKEGNKHSLCYIREKELETEALKVGDSFVQKGEGSKKGNKEGKRECSV